LRKEHLKKGKGNKATPAIAQSPQENSCKPGERTFTFCAAAPSPPKFSILEAILANAMSDPGYMKRYCYDTGANRHVFNNKDHFTAYKSLNYGSVQGATGIATIKGVATAEITVKRSDGSTTKLQLVNVLYCPGFATNVISQRPFKEKGAYYHSGMDGLYMAAAAGTFDLNKDEELAHLPEYDGIPNFLVNDREGPES
jgi:hypothetical protein